MGTSAVGDGTVRECAIITLDNCDELAHCLECVIIKILNPNWYLKNVNLY